MNRTARRVSLGAGLSICTVETHRANLMGKLGLTSRVELVNYVEEHDPHRHLSLSM